MSGSRTDARESGFTLIEVMLAVLLLSVVMGALATAAIVFLRNMSETQARLYVSDARSITSRYLVGDIQAAAVYDPAYTPTPWTGGTTGTVVLPASTPLPTAPVVVAPPVTTCTTTPQPVLTTYHYDVFPASDAEVASKDRATQVEYAVVAPTPPGDDCQLVRTKSAVTKVGGIYDWSVLEQNVVAHDLLVDGVTPMVVATDQGGQRWQVHVRLKPKTTDAIDYDYDLWAKRRVDTIVP